MAGSMVFCVFCFILVLAFDFASKRFKVFSKLNTGSDFQKYLGILLWFIFLASPGFGNGYIAGMAFFALVLRGLIFPVIR